MTPALIGLGIIVGLAVAGFLAGLAYLAIHKWFTG